MTALLVLLSIHYAYELSYNPVCKSVLEFRQEKLIGDALQSKNMSTNYSTLFRAVNCIEQKIEEQADDTLPHEEIAGNGSQDTDETQPYLDNF